MCGIFGAIHNANLNPYDQNVNRLSDALLHRGPDESGQFIDGNVLLGMHRLSIVGISDGHQPIWNSSKTVAIVANGEIYNYQELKSSLENLGYKFSTSSDVECLLHLYSEYGLEFLNNVRGMFAFAIYDKLKNLVTLGRDRLGEKPLYLAELENGYWFSSELSALLKSGISKFKISKDSISLYLKYGFIPAPKSMIDGITQLEPGTILQIDTIKMTTTTHKYWDISHIKNIDQNDPVSEFRNELAIIGESIFQGEAPMGIALSGGMDSSLIALLAKKYGKNVTCITIGYNSDADYDESRMAETFSREIGLDSVVRNISAKEVGLRYPECIAALDEPIADPSTFGYFILGEEANKRGIKVLLSGHGPDEIFNGYPWVSSLSTSHQRRMQTFAGKGSFLSYLTLPKIPIGGSLGNFLDQMKTGFGTIENLIQYLEDRKDLHNSLSSMKFYARRPRARERARISKRLGMDFTVVHDSMEIVETGQSASSNQVLREVLIKTYLQVNGLAQTDRLWMAKSVEGRNLFVDYKLVEIAHADSRNALQAGLKNKSRFIEYVETFLNSEILYRKKRGFTPPVTEWYQEIYRQNLYQLKNSALVRDGILPIEAQRMINRPLTLVRRPRLLWLELVNLEFWYRKNLHYLSN